MEKTSTSQQGQQSIDNRINIAGDVKGKDLFTFNQIINQGSSSETKQLPPFNEASPYKGFKPFEARDAELFFGREQFLKHLISKLDHTNFIFLEGASGSGKSSVIRAGLIPWLIEKRRSNLIELTFTPQQNPFESLHAALLQQRYKQSEIEFVRKSPNEDTLLKVVKTFKQRSQYWLIFIDQFEELFTISQAKLRDCFINSLLLLYQSLPPASSPTSKCTIKIVATMRADFLDRLSPYSEFVKAIENYRLFLTEMQEVELRDAIEQPAGQHGVKVEERLIQEIISDVRGQAGYLPLLQYTLNLLWEEETKSGHIQDHELNYVTYLGLHKVQGAVKKHLDEFYDPLPPEKQQAIKSIFLRIVDIGISTDTGADWKPVRKRVLRSSFTKTVEQEVLDQLIIVNLLISTAPPEALTPQQGNSKANSQAVIEVAHEALLTSWDKLKQWIDENRLAIALRNRLDGDVQEWQRKNKADDELWSGAKLQKVLELREDLTFNQELGGFSPEANLFIDASRELRDRTSQREARRSQTIAILAVAAIGIASLGLFYWIISQQRDVTSLVHSTKANLLFNRSVEAMMDALQAEQMRGQLLLGRRDLKPMVMTALQQAGDSLSESHNIQTQSVVESVDINDIGANQTIVSGDHSGNIKLWNSNGELIKSFPAHGGYILSQFSPDGKTIASTGQDGKVKVWSADGQYLRAWIGHEKKVWGIAFSPDSQMIATAGEDNLIKLWSTDGKLLRVWDGHDGSIWSIHFSPDGKILASGGEDNNIKLWNLDGTLRNTLTGHLGKVDGLAFSRDGKSIASASKDGTVRLWSINGEHLGIFTGHSGRVTTVSFSPDGKTIASGSGDQTVKLWSLNGTLLRTFTGHSSTIWSIDFSADGKTIVSGSADETIKLWDVRKRNLQIIDDERDLYSLSFSPNNKVIASSGIDKTIRLWNSEGTWLKTLHGHNDAVYSVSFSPDGQLIASGSKDATVRLWSTDGKPLKIFQGHEDAVRSVSFSPDGKLIASGSADHDIKLWHLDGTLLTTLEGHTDIVRSVRFNPDGKLIVSGSKDNTIRLWSVDGKLLEVLDTEYEVRAVNFSPDGRIIASGGLDKAVRLWDKQGRLLKTLPGHAWAINSVSFSPDGKMLVSASEDRKINLWSVKNYQLLTTLVEHTKAVETVTFSPDGKTLASGGRDGGIRLWIWDLEQLKTIGCSWMQNYWKNPSNTKLQDSPLLQRLMSELGQSDRRLCNDINPLQ